MVAFLPPLALAIALLAMLPGCSGEGDAGPADSPASVLLITIDTLRADRLGCTGHGAAHTPVLDGLARDGIVFDHVIVPVPITLPSHASLMTGLLPHELGIRDNRPFALSGEATTIAEIVKDAGFRTVAVVSGEPLAPGCGLEQGFDEYLFRPAPRRASVLLRESPADRTVDAALGAAGDLDGNEPFFFWVHFFDPHIPYASPAGIPGGDAYDGEVAFVDREIGRLLAGLEERGLMKKTLTLVTSDHGEGLGAHGEPTHAYFLFDTTLRVPLIAKGPGIPSGRSVTSQVRFLDLPGALLKMLGLGGGRSSRGADRLVALLRGKGKVDPAAPLFSESLFCSHHFHWAELRSLRTDSFKVVSGAKVEIFDLAGDPDETRPLAPEAAPEEARRLAETLEGKIASARSLADPGPKLSGSLPGYLGGTAGEARLFLGAEKNALRPHPTDRAELLNRFLKGVEASQEGNLNMARGLLEEICAEDPNNPSGLFWLGRTFRALGEKEGDSRALERACELFREAHRLDPGFLDAFHLATWCLVQLGRFEEAAGPLSRHLEMERDDAKGHELLGWLLTTEESNGRKNPLHAPARGAESFARSLDLNQNNPGLLQKLVALYKSLKQPELAEKYRRKLHVLEASGTP